MALLRIWQSFRVFATKHKWALLVLGCLVAALSYVGPSVIRKAQMDSEVDRLCAIDGGLKIYERIELPEDQFNQSGFPTIFFATNKNSSKDLYVIENLSRDLVSGNSYGRWRPTLIRGHYRVIRRSDSKILGEAVTYMRFGGDPDSPLHPSNYVGCTPHAKNELMRALFVKR